MAGLAPGRREDSCTSTGGCGRSRKVFGVASPSRFWSAWPPWWPASRGWRCWAGCSLGCWPGIRWRRSRRRSCSRPPPWSGAARSTTRARWWRTAPRPSCSNACGSCCTSTWRSLGPAHFVRERTGEVMLSLVEGVQQLEVYFGQYLPQLFVAALTPVLIFAFVAFLDLPVALVFSGHGAGDAAGADAVARLGQPGQPRPQSRLRRLRRRVPRRPAGTGHAEGVRPERRARPSSGGARARAVQEHDVGARHQHAGARHHRHRHRGRRRRRAGARRVARGRTAACRCPRC